MKPPHVGEGRRAEPRVCIENPAICLINEEKSRKNLSKINRRGIGCLAPKAIRLVELAIVGNGLNRPAGQCRPWLLRQATGSTIVQRKYLPSCRTRGFPTSANFESKLSARVLMWSANCGMPRSPCVCLLLTCQEVPAARRRHLDFKTCKLRTWERVADLHAELP